MGCVRGLGRHHMEQRSAREGPKAQVRPRSEEQPLLGVWRHPRQSRVPKDQRGVAGGGRAHILPIVPVRSPVMVPEASKVMAPPPRLI